MSKKMSPKSKKPSLLSQLWHKDWTKPLAAVKGAAGFLGASVYGLAHNDQFKGAMDKVYGQNKTWLIAGIVLAAAGGMTWLASKHE